MKKDRFSTIRNDPQKPRLNWWEKWRQAQIFENEVQK